MKSCDMKKSNLENLKNCDNVEDNIFFSEINMSKEDQSHLKGIMGWFLKRIGSKTVVTSKELQNKIYKDYKGKEAERVYLLTELSSILDANPGIREMINEQAAIQMLKTERKAVIAAGINKRKAEVNALPKYKKSYTKKEEKQIKDFADKNNINYKPYEPIETILRNIQMEHTGIDYSDLSIASLRLLLGKSREIIENGFGEKLRGTIGKLRVEVSTALGLAKYDSTGAIYNMAQGVVNFTQNITRHINRFVDESGNRFKDTGSSRKYGMNTLFNKMEAISERVLSAPLKEALKFNNEMSTDFFNRILAGWVKWDGNQYIIAESYDVARDENGQIRKYEETGDAIYEFQNYISFKDYLKKKNKIRNLTRAEKNKSERYHRSFFVDENYVKMVDQLTSAQKEINDLVNQARGIHSEVFKYAEKQFNKTHNQLMIELKQYFPNLSNNEIKSLLMSKDITKEDAFIDLEQKQQDDLQYIVDSFGSYSILDPYIFGAQEFKEKKDGFPIIYNQDYFQNVMWEEALNEAKTNLANAESELSSIRNLFINDKSNAEYKALYNEALRKKKELSTEVARMELIRDRFDEYPQDHQGNTMPLARDVSVLKRITNSFDIRNQRADKLVYNEYLNRLFSGLERNNLSVRLLKSLRLAKSTAAKNAIVSQYKGINNDPSARSSFLGVPTDLESAVVFINKIPLTNITSDKLSRKIRAFNSWITGMYLRGTSSAILNFTAIQEGFFHLGIKTMTRALSVMEKQKSAVENLVKISGIVDFSDFIQKGLVQKAVDMDFTIEQANNVTTAILKYYKDLSVGKNKNKSLRELRKVLVIEAENIPSLERTKGRISRRRQDKVRRIVNTFANYAIEKDYQYRETVSKIPYKILFDKATKLPRKGIQEWGKLQRQFNLTMGQTETKLRTWQFIAGIQSSMDSDLIPNVPIEELKGNDLEAAINLGRMYVQVSAFSVGRENIGEISRGEIGGFLTKFKYYAMQKFGSDVNRFKDAYAEMEDGLNSGKFKTLAKLLKEMTPFIGTPQSVLRTTKPNVAALKSFIAIQGVLTQIMDLFIFGPFSVARHIPGLRRVFYAVPGARALGGATSDLISLSMLLPNIFIAMQLGDFGEDEDDLRDTFEHYMRRTVFGFGATWTYDNIMTLLSLLQDADTEEKARNIKKSLSPVLPREINNLQLTKKAIEYSVDEFLD